MIVCKKVRYVGNVQGVGFRYTTQKLAIGFPIKGYVMNLPNGEVELQIEGDEVVVAEFLASLADRMSNYIRQVKIEDMAPVGYLDFSIRY